jgi:hypothetical protein
MIREPEEEWSVAHQGGDAGYQIFPGFFAAAGCFSLPLPSFHKTTGVVTCWN